MEKCSGRWRQPKDRCFSSALHGGQQEQWDACALIKTKRNTNSHTHILRRQSQHNHVSCFISQAMCFAPRTADLFCSSKINYTPYQVCRCSVDSGIMQLDYLALLNRVLCLNKHFLCMSLFLKTFENASCLFLIKSHREQWPLAKFCECSNENHARLQTQGVIIHNISTHRETYG